MAKQKILYFYFKTGGGHFFSAKALAKAVETAYPEAENVLVDGLPPGKSFWRTVMEDGYRFAVQDWPFLWPMLYNISKLHLIRTFQLFNIQNVCQRHIEEEITKHQATKIVVLHFLLVRPIMNVLKKMKLNIPVLEVVTDPFTVHPFWWHHKNVKAAVFSERAKNDAIKYGWKPEYLTVFPIMLRPEFAGSLSPQQIVDKKKTYDVPMNTPIILLAGGGDGLPNSDRLLLECEKLNLPAYFLVVTGKNEVQKKNLEKMLENRPDLKKRVKVFGFIDFMFDLMNLSDIIVTKGGPATIMEILLIGKPPLVMNYIYGQEQGNVDFLLEHKIGDYISNPKKLAHKLRDLLLNPSELNAMRERIQALHLSNGTKAVAEWVWKST